MNSVVSLLVLPQRRTSCQSLILHAQTSAVGPSRQCARKLCQRKTTAWYTQMCWKLQEQKTKKEYFKKEDASNLTWGSRSCKCTTKSPGEQTRLTRKLRRITSVSSFYLLFECALFLQNASWIYLLLELRTRVFTTGVFILYRTTQVTIHTYLPGVQDGHARQHICKAYQTRAVW